MEISADLLWSEVLERLQLQLSRPTFETWIKTATLLEWQNNCLVICTFNTFIIHKLYKYNIIIVTCVVQEVVGRPVEIQLTAAQSEFSSSITYTNTISSERLPPNHPPKPTELNPKYTFARFVVCPTNRMAHAASLAVAESPGSDLNPLFLPEK